MQKVDDVISQWSHEEREQLRDLIKECREREKSIEVNGKISWDGLRRICDSLKGMAYDLMTIGEKIKGRA